MIHLEWPFKTCAFVQHAKRLTIQTEMSSGDIVMAVKGGFIAVAYTSWSREPIKWKSYVILRICKDKQLSLDKELIQLLCMPVFQGKQNAVIGNVLLTSIVWNDFQDLCENGKGDMGPNWRTRIMFDALKQAKRSYGYYKYPVCAAKKNRNGTYSVPMVHIHIEVSLVLFCQSTHSFVQASWNPFWHLCLLHCPFCAARHLFLRCLVWMYSMKCNNVNWKRNLNNGSGIQKYACHSWCTEKPWIILIHLSCGPFINPKRIWQSN